MRNLHLLFLVAITLLTACNGPAKTVQEEPAQKVLPQIPQAEVAKLYAECSSVDFIFKSLPISVSQTDKPSLQAMAASIDPSIKANVDPNCQPMARQIYLIDGEIYMESDIFYSEFCKYYVYYKNNEAVYACGMSATQMNFLQNILAQVKPK